MASFPPSGGGGVDSPCPRHKQSPSQLLLVRPGERGAMEGWKLKIEEQKNEDGGRDERGKDGGRSGGVEEWRSGGVEECFREQL